MNRLSTRSKEYKAKLNSYLLEAIEFEDQPDLNDREKLTAFFDEFDRCAGYTYNLHKFPTCQDRLADWLLGLPSCISIPFSNWDILKFTAKLHGIKNFTEREHNTILANYWSHIAFYLIKLNDSVK